MWSAARLPLYPSRLHPEFWQVFFWQFFPLNQKLSSRPGGRQPRSSNLISFSLLVLDSRHCSRHGWDCSDVYLLPSPVKQTNLHFGWRTSAFRQALQPSPEQQQRIGIADEERTDMVEHTFIPGRAATQMFFLPLPHGQLLSRNGDRQSSRSLGSTASWWRGTDGHGTSTKGTQGKRRSTAQGSRTTPPTLGLPTSGRVRTATTVDSASLPCCPSHCFGSLHTSVSSVWNSSPYNLYTLRCGGGLRSLSTAPNFDKKPTRLLGGGMLHPAQCMALEDRIWKKSRIKKRDRWFFMILDLFDSCSYKNIFLWAASSTRTSSTATIHSLHMSVPSLKLLPVSEKEVVPCSEVNQEAQVMPIMPLHMRSKISPKRWKPDFSLRRSAPPT